ncbi:MAG: hypothetical protein A2046_14795 [Bacteroidetes bacterium GWA2_30_7]|nr:MAG: hypothetical protein A2046_14795 [Bacteroidetes bacterium GWA2_30_7]
MEQEFKKCVKPIVQEIILTYFIAMFAFVSQAQTSLFAKPDTAKLIVKQLSFYTYNENNENIIPLSNYTFNNRILLSPFNIYHDSLYIKNSRFNHFYNSENKLMLISNKYYYDVNNPLAPFGRCFGCAIAAGSLNYLFLLFKKNK